MNILRGLFALPALPACKHDWEYVSNEAYGSNRVCLLCGRHEKPIDRRWVPLEEWRQARENERQREVLAVKIVKKAYQDGLMR